MPSAPALSRRMVTASPLVVELAREIGDLIRLGEIGAGEKLATQKLANRFGVSRSPVREALSLLHRQGMIEQRPNRGYFAKADGNTAQFPEGEFLPRSEPSEYHAIAEDWLANRIPAEVTEQMLRERYGLTKAQVNDILVRATREGWAERKQGYGWRFLPVARTAEAFEQIYRFRMIVEPAAFLEPTFRLDRTVLAEQRRIQERLLETDIDRVPAERLLESGSLFHEELIRMCGNPFLHMSLVRVNRMRRLLEYRANLDRQRLLVQCTEHLQILDALERNNVLETSYLMRQHLSGALVRKSPVQIAKEPFPPIAGRRASAEVMGDGGPARPGSGWSAARPGSYGRDADQGAPCAADRSRTTAGPTRRR